MYNTLLHVHVSDFDRKAGTNILESWHRYLNSRSIQAGGTRRIERLQQSIRFSAILWNKNRSALVAFAPLISSQVQFH
jgi:hypothetical protein